MKQELKVSGMTCGHCAHAVTEELSAIDGVVAVEVDLVPGEVSNVTVETTGELDEAQVRAALSEAGDYHLA